MSDQRSFELIRVFHPSFHVLDLGDTERWYEEVFGRPSMRLSPVPVDLDNRMDYSTFTLIQDVLIDSIDPKLFVKHGEQQYETVDEPHLKNFGWCVEGLLDLYREVRATGIRLVGNLGEEGTDDEPPTAVGSAVTMFFTVPEETGLRYQFIAPMALPFDARSQEGWVLAPRDDDPLSIEFTSHHTILTGQPERALRLFVDALGGTVLARGRDEIRGAVSTYVQLADAVFELAVPDEGTPAHDDWQHDAPLDTYHAITFKVSDLDQVRRHLAKVGVALRSDDGTFIVTEPRTSMGVPWGFTSEAIPGDTRAS